MVGPVTTRSLIVHVVNSLETGGLENGVVNLVNVAGERFRHAVICLTTEGSLRNRLKPAVEVLTIGKRPGIDLRAFGRLTLLLRRLRPAVVHSRNWATFDTVVAARLARAPAVVHGEHGRDITDPEGKNPRRTRFRRAFAPLVDRFVAVSRDLERWLVEEIRLPADKVVTIPNGVDLARFGALGRPEARRRLGIPVDRVVVGTVGRLDPVKDQAGLVEAFARLRAKRPDALLVIVGDGPCRALLTGLIARRGLQDHALVLGERRDIPEILAALDVFVLPSIAEGMSNTVLEAMSTGLPVVATRVGGNPELVEDGLTGRLVSPLDPAALAAAIEGYLDDSHLRLLHGKASRQRAVDHFDLTRMAGAYRDLYTAVLEKRPPRSA
jgi:sugar transferase (PEP-CTERM/EpsH1 system associated)